MKPFMSIAAVGRLPKRPLRRQRHARFLGRRFPQLRPRRGMVGIWAMVRFWRSLQALCSRWSLAGGCAVLSRQPIPGSCSRRPPHRQQAW
jgi:hypothetical protein